MALNSSMRAKTEIIGIYLSYNGKLSDRCVNATFIRSHGKYTAPINVGYMATQVHKQGLYDGWCLVPLDYCRPNAAAIKWSLEQN